ncbi:MAG TPA: ATP-dependent DNA helicase RecQ [Chitinophagales bacterium]|nr:ATP-dependent DNA helicase RecQ [Chitinophagales bacterium]
MEEVKAQLSISLSPIEVLSRYWGFHAFRPLQEDIINSILQGNDTLALLPTGGGKSVCYQVPAMMKEGICIVISPLIALMKDQVAGLRKRKIKAIAIYSGMKKREIDMLLDNCVHGAYKFLYLSPERLATDIVKARIEQMPVNLLAVDEAHCISQWGYDFRPPYLKIAEIRPLLKDVPVLALTATATAEVKNDICEKLEFRNKKIFQSSFERKNIAYVVRYEENKLHKLVTIFERIPGCGIVYVRNRKHTKEISDFLRKNRIAADYYHAGLDLSERNIKQEKWIAGETRVMVCTNAFGMGIDKPDVRCVVHVDLPENIEMYYQESGRAGRDGRKSFAVLLYNLSDKSETEKRIRSSFPSLKEIENIYTALGNYFQIAVGAGKGESYDFDIAAFSKTYNFEILKVHHALRLLEQQGLLAVSDAVFTSARIQIIVKKDELYKFQVANAGSDHIVKFLLRTHSGLFDEMVNVNEAEIAKRLKIDKQEVVRTLELLDHLHIAVYEKQNDKPQLTLLEAREDTRYLRLDAEFIEKRRKHYEHNLLSMLAYAMNKNRCRSQFVLDYFGETDNYRCGICDICLERNKIGMTDIEFDAVADEIKKQFSAEDKNLDSIVRNIRNFSEQKVLNVLRWLMDSGQIVQVGNQLRWKG